MFPAVFFSVLLSATRYEHSRRTVVNGYFTGLPTFIPWTELGPSICAEKRTKHLRERNAVIEPYGVEDGGDVLAQSGKAGIGSGGEPVVFDQPPESLDAVEVRTVRRRKQQAQALSPPRGALGFDELAAVAGPVVEDQDARAA